MTTKKKELVWRLGTLPTISELKELIDSGVINNMEARDILFKEKEEPKKAAPSELDDIKRELELLRELILANTQPRIAYPIIIKQDHTITTRPWFNQYATYCSSTTPTNITY
jgi:hypothetical protein